MINTCLTPFVTQKLVEHVIPQRTRGQARVQEFAREGAQNLKAFFFFFFFFLLFNNFSGGGPAQKLAEKMTFST